jgi:hypothetical protein
MYKQDALKQARQVASLFLPEGERMELRLYGSGNINDTRLLTLENGEQRILQRINPVVFKRSDRVISNMHLVTNHLQNELKIKKIPADIFQVPTLLPTREGAVCHRTPDQACWRMLSFIPDCRTLETIQEPEQALELGEKLALFHDLLSNLEPDLLSDTLPGFHATENYLQTYDRIIESAACPVSHETIYCRRFIETHRNLATILEDEAPLRHQVIHGDPKVANFLFHQQSNRVISLIDLDTVKPGLLLHDIGDALRSCCNPAGESVTQPQQIVFDDTLFQSWLRGYFSGAGSWLTKQDQERMVAAALLITFELGLRFFTDFLAGDCYFKCNYPGHNLMRAKVQFHLTELIEKKRSRLEAVVKTLASQVHDKYP